MVKWFRAKFIIVLLEFNLPDGGARANFVGFIPIDKVVVVGPYNDRYRGASKEI